MVGIGELRASADPEAILVAYGLGSCVGVCLYDPVARVGGLAHVMLPSSLEAANNAATSRFADTAIPMLLARMAELGGDSRRTAGKIAGGASMLNGAAFSDGFNIGARNVEAVKSALSRLGVPILAADVGGSRGRTLSIHLGSGTVLVRMAGEKDTEL